MTRYDLFRKRIAPILFLGVVGLIAYDACRKDQRTHAKVVLDLGAAEPDVREIDAQLIVGGDAIGQFHKVALPGSTIGTCTFETALPDDTARMVFDVDVRGAHKHFEHTLRPFDGSTVHVPLENDLR